MLKKSIEKLMRKQNLDHESCEQTFNELLDPQSNPLQIAAFLALLRAKPETPEEIAAIVSTLRKKMISIPKQCKLLDIVGTGGDGAQTVNISTGSAILAASCGAKVAKHGNRAVSSLSGSADVLEALGIDIDLPAEKINACIQEVGIAFCFSPNFHPVLKQLRALRKELNIPTTFNILGPLLNPAHADCFLLGVFDTALMPIIAEVLKQTGSERSIVVHGCGLDEISCVGPAEIIEVTPTKITKSIIDPTQFGFPRCQVSDLKGGDAKTNATLLIETFKGKSGPIADTLTLNAAVALWVYGLYPSIKEAIPAVKDNLASGAPLKLLNNWIAFTHA